MITALFIASPLLNLLTRIMETIIATLSVALSGIWNALQALTPDLVPPLTPEDMELATEAADNAGVSDGTKIIWILLMLAAILLVTLALSRLNRQATIAAINREELGRQAIEPGEKPNLLQRALQKLGLLRGLSAALSIRRIYWQMCRAAAGAGYPRLATETPYEYLITLARVWPGQTADARLITQAYVRIRYGELPESEAEIKKIRAAWQRLEESQPMPYAESKTV
jgi:hypothetical protein